jgi:hypothetical protein
VLKANPPDSSKPLWVGEGSWGETSAPGAWWQDPYAQGGFIPRYFATIWSQTLPYGSNPCSLQNDGGVPCIQAFWYGYDYDTTTPNCNPKCYKTSQVGALYCAGQTAHGSCANGGPNHNEAAAPILPQADMWNVAVGWLSGAQIPPSGGFCNLLAGSQTVWHCDFTNSGNSYSMVWDNSYSQNAKANSSYCTKNFPSNPYVCGQTAYTVLPQYTHWQDLSGTTRNIGWSVPLLVGLNPILLEP